MRTRRRTDANEERQLQEFVDNIGAPRVPVVRVYRLAEDGKQTRLGVVTLDVFDEQYLRDCFGAGTYLIRTVRSNGTYGPSKVLRIAERPKNSW